MRVLLTGGGTAGHINPALAIAETILQNEPDSSVAFVGLRGGKEVDLIPRKAFYFQYRCLLAGAYLSVCEKYG